MRERESGVRGYVRTTLFVMVRRAIRVRSAPWTESVEDMFITSVFGYILLLNSLYVFGIKVSTHLLTTGTT